MAEKDPRKVAAGSKGGRKTALKYGPAHMSMIGTKGFMTTCERYFNGDTIKCQAWLAGTKGASFPNPHGNHPLMEARTRLLERQA